MLKASQSGRTRRLKLVEDSPLRAVDPRTKLAMSLCSSLAVMLPLERLVVFMAVYGIVLLWARLMPEAAKQVWRLRWIITVLFVVDWLLVGLDLAIIVTLRLVLLAGVFALFFATTTSSELGLALESLWVPYRYAFSLSLAFQSLGLLEDEWRNIREIQRVRGIPGGEAGLRKVAQQVRNLVALTVPAVVMTTKRAWSMTEAACARGFDSPNRRPYRRLEFSLLDWFLLAATAVMTVLLFWRQVSS